jgi:NADPH:quinone reductase-like Zn-dependent oxidoreductase
LAGPEVMEIEEVPVPQPQDDEVLVRVHAAVNPVDYKIRRGGYVGTDKLLISSSISSVARRRNARGLC